MKQGFTVQLNIVYKQIKFGPTRKHRVESSLKPTLIMDIYIHLVTTLRDGQTVYKQSVKAQKRL